jgi:hypothetical protein
MNRFEEIYGENVLYSRLEQESYLELKEKALEAFPRKIKFRKHERIGMVLTIRAEITQAELKKFIELQKSDFFVFISNFVVSNIKTMDQTSEN